MGGDLARVGEFLDYCQPARAALGVFPAWREWMDAQLLSQEPRTAQRMGIELQEWIEVEGATDTAKMVEILRRFKRREMLRIGVRDYCNAAPMSESFAELSQLASLCIERVSHWYWCEHSKKYGTPPHPYIVVGLGKLGGRELNYSSDVDVMFVYGQEDVLESGQTCHEWYCAWARDIALAFNKRTGEGQLFRMDLRLRPDGDAGPLARSLDACENYYYSCGETWERLAMMKARCVAGDPELAYGFGVMIQPFCYSKNLPHEAVRETAAIKDRMETELLDPETLELDVKRGLGGIREIEFTLQVQQLLHGARHAYLQDTSTLKAMDALQRGHFFDGDTVADLREAYFFWRRVEHRIQMEEEAQTHRLPTAPEQRARLAGSLGYDSLEAFECERVKHRDKVRAHYDRLVREPAEKLASPSDPWQGFAPEVKSLVTRMKGSGGNLSNVSQRTRGSFLKLEPLLASELANLVAPEEALVGVVNFSERYGSLGHLYETWATQPQVLRLLLRLFDASVKFRDLLVAQPDWLEDICRNSSLDAVHGMSHYVEVCSQCHTLDELRGCRWEEGLRIAIQDAIGLLSAEQREFEHTSLAEACVCRVVELCGAVDTTVVAAGKFGGWELGFGSDLDLLFLEGTAAQARQILKALTETTAAGSLFPSDARLRPEGDNGELTVSVEFALDYYARRAGTWEYLAATKFRRISGPACYDTFFGGLVQLWCERGQRHETIPAILEMREKIVQGRDKDVPDERRMKTGVGGIMDIEFAVQAWQISRGHPECRTRAALRLMAEEFPDESVVLLEGYETIRAVESVMRRRSFASASSLPADGAALERLAKRSGYPSAAEMMHALAECRRRVRASYDSVMRSLRR